LDQAVIFFVNSLNRSLVIVANGLENPQFLFCNSHNYLFLIPIGLLSNPQKNKKKSFKFGLLSFTSRINLQLFNFNIQKPKRMKKFFAILAIVALASCGGSSEAPAADTMAPAVDTMAAAVDTTAAAPAETK